MATTPTTTEQNEHYKQEQKTFKELILALKDNTKKYVSSTTESIKKAPKNAYDATIDKTTNALGKVKSSINVENISRLLLDNETANVFNSVLDLFSGATKGEKKERVSPKSNAPVIPDDEPVTTQTKQDELPSREQSSNNNGVNPSDKKMDDLIAKQSESIELLKHIDENTKVDDLKAREDEIKARNKERQSKVPVNTDKKGLIGGALAGGIMGGISDFLTHALGGYLGAKGIGAISDIMTGKKTSVPPVIAGDTNSKKTNSPKPAKTPRGKVGMLTKLGGLLGIGAVAATTVSSASEYIDNSVVNNKTAPTTNNSKATTVNNNASKSAVADVVSKGSLVSDSKGVASKATGLIGKAATPLAVLSTGYELYDVTTDETLTQSEKNKEYTSIGTRLAGAWVGAKAGGIAGATAGGAVGGVAGTVVPGAGNVVGAAGGATVGGLIGAVTGGIAGYYAGDVAGDVIGDSLFGENSSEEVIYNTMNDQDATYPALIQEYIQGTPGVPYINVEEMYHKYLKSKGIRFDDKTAAIAITKLRNHNISKRVEIKKLSELVENNESVVNPKTFESIVSPQIRSDSAVITDVGASRNKALSTLSSEMDQLHIQKSINETREQTVQPIIIDNSSNTNNTSSNTGENSRTRTGVPSTRNNENTIQRLLENSYRPLLN